MKLHWVEISLYLHRIDKLIINLWILIADKFMLCIDDKKTQNTLHTRFLWDQPVAVKGYN